MRAQFNVYDFAATDLDGRLVRLSDFADKVLLIVNTASKGPGKKMLKKLEGLRLEYKDRAFEVLAFPCRQFMRQESKTAEKIKEKYLDKAEVTFPVFSRIKVNGPHAHPLYKWLKKQKKGSTGSRIEWNFTKFVVDSEGNVVKRFSSNSSWSKIESEIERYVEAHEKALEHRQEVRENEKKAIEDLKGVPQPIPMSKTPGIRRVGADKVERPPEMAIEIVDF